jgi:catechol 2,3-dioxygenase-like lactoylglutathione lyase family enzyme
MELGHIALTVTDHNEIQGFYHEVLGMKEIRSFSLDKHLVRHIFGIEETTTVVQLQKDGLLLELFITPEPCDHPYHHVCISTAHREEIVKRAMQHSYKCVRIKRPKSDMIFISDHSGNLFEMKQSNTVPGHDENN